MRRTVFRQQTAIRLLCQDRRQVFDPEKVSCAVSKHDVRNLTTEWQKQLNARSRLSVFEVKVMVVIIISALPSCYLIFLQPVTLLHLFKVS